MSLQISQSIKGQHEVEYNGLFVKKLDLTQDQTFDPQKVL